MFTAQTSAGIDYRERPGSGPSLVLLHGIGSNADSFAELLPLLPPDRQVVAWNAPGYGASAPLGPDWPVAADYADALEAFLDRLGLDRVTLVGHSLGTLMGAAFAVARPARVRFVTVLPKTRSGKLLRRAIQAVCESRDPGDLTTIEDPSALQQIKDLVAASA